MNHTNKEITEYWVMRVDDNKFIEIDWNVGNSIDGFDIVHNLAEATLLTDKDKKRFTNIAEEYGAKFVKVLLTEETTIETVDE